MPENIGLIVEGAIQLLIVVIIIATIARRGKNLYLMILGSFLFLIGVLTLFLAFYSNSKILSEMSLSNHLIDFFEHEVTYFGVAGYLIFQLSMIYGQKAIRGQTFGILSVATILVAIHSYDLPFLNLSMAQKNFFGILSYWMTIVFFVASLITVFFILLFLFKQLKKNNDLASNYITTICTGIGVMIAALLIMKALNPFVGSSLVDLLIFLSYGMALSGFMIQISLISLPGIVYNYDTRLPIPLATVRIINKDNNRMIESKVTGKNGRYETFLDTGRYAITVMAEGYIFPSKNIVGYQGEEIKIKRPTLISLDIPLEPIRR